ncbi:hypothetical protein [Tuwongella immobilis]|uniref:Uncharacterized protein n=1 Tax=Tuwongella immobilis TaxID=692036 RepID=A0A6C2YUF7_9BACT|nr:hypothetical protein [Tuwongella immobilis]VIP04783.1 unnamed protein product [Tuwongella immobilis]VTS06925.1 unnamed protein product [Tuwongella immobilis]
MSPTESRAALQEQLRTYFLAMAAVKSDEDKNEGEVESFVFRMTEFLDAASDYATLCDQSSHYSTEDFKQLMNSLLYHGLPHLIAAARKYDYVPDIL